MVKKNLLDDTYDIIKNKNINMIIELHSQSIEDSITKNLNQYGISYSIVDSYKNTKLIRKVNYMKWLII